MRRSLSLSLGMRAIMLVSLTSPPGLGLLGELEALMLARLRLHQLLSGASRGDCSYVGNLGPLHRLLLSAAMVAKDGGGGVADAAAAAFLMPCVGFSG